MNPSVTVLPAAAYDAGVVPLFEAYEVCVSVGPAVSTVTAVEVVAILALPALSTSAPAGIVKATDPFPLIPVTVAVVAALFTLAMSVDATPMPVLTTVKLMVLRPVPPVSVEVTEKFAVLVPPRALMNGVLGTPIVTIGLIVSTIIVPEVEVKFPAASVAVSVTNFDPSPGFSVNEMDVLEAPAEGEIMFVTSLTTSPLTV